MKRSQWQKYASEYTANLFAKHSYLCFIELGFHCFPETLTDV
jgi:hypothetical protein